MEFDLTAHVLLVCEYVIHGPTTLRCTPQCPLRISPISTLFAEMVEEEAAEAEGLRAVDREAAMTPILLRKTR
jgi:hypothetical protein